MGYRLTMSQREILETLIKLYEKRGRLVKSREIAEETHRDEGTVRNIILSLKSLGLVESKTGPSGGYMPTLKAYEVLRGPMVQMYMKLKKHGRELDVAVSNIELLDVFNPEGGRALLKVYGDLSKINVGDYITIGPAPYTRIVIEGIVTHIDRRNNQLALSIKKIISVPRTPVGAVMTKRLVTLPPDATVREAADTLIRKGIHGAPVKDEEKGLVGMFTLRDAARALAEGAVDAKVAEYMSRPLVTVREDEDILRAMELMRERGVGRLVVLDMRGQPVGIVTKTDILRHIAGLRRP